jgi:hypothetical protein
MELKSENPNPSRWFARPQFIVLGLLLAVFVLPMILFFGWYHLNTDYSDLRVPFNYKRVQMGDSVDRLYEMLGTPFYVLVRHRSAVSNFDSYPEARDVASMKRALADTNKEFALVYSSPRFGDCYIEYAVSLWDGKVSNKWGPQYMD